MTMNTLRDLFEHELEDIYYAEKVLLDTLEEFAEHVENEEISSAFEEHREETEGHIDRLEEVFDRLEMEPEEEECEGIEGLVAEHDEFMEMDADQGISDVFHVTAAEKTEHYEIAAYGNLAFMAQQMDMEEVAQLLGQNLDEEEQALEKLKTLTEEYDYDQIELAA